MVFGNGKGDDLEKYQAGTMYQVKSAKECQDYCRLNQNCQVFTYYATDESGELDMGRCFLYADTEDCSPGKTPIEHMAGA